MNKRKTPAQVLKEIQKLCGTESITMMGKTKINVERVSSGILSLDKALGGGYPKGRIIEMSGAESSGKTTVSLHAIAEVQRCGGVAAFVDAENSLDLEWATKIGVDTSHLLLSQPGCGEEALDLVEKLVDSEGVDLIVVDSVAALVPKAELEGEMGQSHIGLQARLMSQAMRKLAATINKSDAIVFFINQIRMKIGVMFNNPEVTAGGRALPYYASIRMDSRRVATCKDNNGVPILNNIRVRVKKNKVAPPFRVAEFELDFKCGVNKYGVLLDLGTELGIVSRAGAWYNYGNMRLGQGREKAKLFLENTRQLSDEIETKIKEKI